ncbi:prolipoprotein diacylglyceryl transferase [Planctomycetes bacterium K23_9]|uniref:Phosphatidylglycerol--prolipoprotein diacylglyceryl transferase n=1 Tax=Stieleria marina TaxID=1930275 RepID=A0A517NSN9_9BACT|nr:Prolipoprotein diacylglyceryl transferase [Planctomycetes bacterium K23_9]
MRRTLLLIPHEIAGLPVFGFGWILGAIIVAAIARVVFAKKTGQNVGQLVANEGIMWAIAAAAVAFVLPAVELTNVMDEPVGMAIRGYGVMLLTAVVAAVGLAAVRAKNRGIDPEVIYSLAPWVFVGGIAGARIFYLIQYHDRFIWDSPVAYLKNLFAFTEGGLVVYGSFIGGFLAGSLFIARNKLPLLRLGDAIVPCMFLGVCLGRIGCFMNGCCYGGRCEPNWNSVRFPAGSAVYNEQLISGELLGMKVNQKKHLVTSVDPSSLADQKGISKGDELSEITFAPAPTIEGMADLPREDVLPGVIARVNLTDEHYWPPAELPDRALPVQAAQLISSGSSLVLCGLLCGLSLWIRREGAIMMIGLGSYAGLRFVLEMVRVDEAGQFGTALSISQWVSVFVGSAAIIGLIWVIRRELPASVSSENRPASGEPHDEVSA